LVLFVSHLTVEPWFMPLFFVLAGWAIFHSLQTRNSRSFVRERIQKILIPLLVGCVLFAPPIKYLELRSGFNATPLSLCPKDPIHRLEPCIPASPDITLPFDESFIEFLPTFFTRFERFTWSHLWFLAYLFTLSLLYLPLFLRLMKTRLTLAQVSTGWVYSPMILLLSIEITLRPRWPSLNNLHNDWANLAYFSTCLITGFLLACYPALEQALQREWKRALGISLVGMVVRVPTAVGLVISSPLSAVSLVVAGWATIVALLGFARSRLTHTNVILDYFKESAYPVYILHQAAVVCIGYWIIQLSLGIAVKYTLLLAAALAATLATYHFIVRPIPILRFAFGMKPLP
jgi:membrane-bound acyltransferase YfiQ involved in biofilm formation